MIRIIDAEIENYRSIMGEPLKIYFTNYNVVVGPNNSGKSNILRALNLFFNGIAEDTEYQPEHDYPKSSSVGSRAQTKITITVKFTPTKDTRLNKAITELEKESGQLRLSDNRLRLRLEYSKHGKVQWKFISKAGLRSIKAELVRPVVETLRDSVRYKYLPVGRDTLTTIRTELRDELIKTIFNGWSGAVKARQEINQSISKLIKKLEPQLANSGSEITDAMSSVFNEIKKLEIKLPFNDLETMIPSLEPSVSDHYETGLKAKGSGVQTSSLLFFLKYLADHHPQRHNAKVTYIWAIEEPESFLHPSRQKAMSKVLREFSSEVQTIVSTHSPHFIPRSTKSSVIIVEKEDAAPYSTIIAGNDYELARQLLGVSLLDSMYLYETNIVVEGISDEIILRGAWEMLFENKLITTDPNSIRFFPGNNANGACTLYESLTRFGDSDEVNILLILDGDDAGKKALHGLQSRVKDEITIKPNKDYFQLPQDIEWLTSAKVISKLAEERPAQVAVDINTDNEITGFTIKGQYKSKVARRIIELSNIGDLDEHIKLIEKIETQILS